MTAVLSKINILLLTSIEPPVCILMGFRTFRCTMKFGRRASGGTSQIMATRALHYNKFINYYTSDLSILQKPSSLC